MADVSLGTLNFIVLFDVITCIILLFDWFMKMNGKNNKMQFLKANLLYIIAIIPFELVFSMYFISFRLLLLFKLFKLSNVVEKYFNNFHRFLENTKLDKILGWIVFTVIIFTFSLYVMDPSLNLFDSLWFVVVTLTTVGYGDVTPKYICCKSNISVLACNGNFCILNTVWCDIFLLYR
ncbi:MAG: potassium channel family protein [Methanobrevibacter sp.]|nr:potassium channel family protein [Methanobrevibacter sp.]